MSESKPVIKIIYVYMCLYMVSYIILPILKIYDSEWVSTTRLYQEEKATEPIIWSMVGLFALLIGYFISKYLLRDHGLLKRIDKYSISYKVARRAWAYNLGVLLLFITYFLIRYGVQGLLFDREETFRGEGITLFVYSTLVIHSSIFSLYVYQYNKSKKVVLFQTAFLIVAGFGSRGSVLVYLLCLFYFVNRQKKINLRRFLMATIFSAIFAGMLIGLVIARTQDIQGIPMWFVIRSVTNTFEEGEMFAAIYHWYSNNYLLGSTIIDIGYVFLPRQIFSDKPLIWGKAIFERDLGFIDPTNEGLGGASVVFGQLSELYANFGHFGVIVGMIMWGLFLGRIEMIGRKKRLGSLNIMIYLIAFHLLLWIFRHGLLGLVQAGLFHAIFIPLFTKIYFEKNRVN